MTSKGDEVVELAKNLSCMMDGHPLMVCASALTILIAGIINDHNDKAAMYQQFIEAIREHSIGKPS